MQSLVQRTQLRHDERMLGLSEVCVIAVLVCQFRLALRSNDDLRKGGNQLHAPQVILSAEWITSSWTGPDRECGRLTALSREATMASRASLTAP